MGELKLRRLQKIANERLFTLKSSNRKLDTFSADRVMNSLNPCKAGHREALIGR